MCVCIKTLWKYFLSTVYIKIFHFYYFRHVKKKEKKKTDYLDKREKTAASEKTKLLIELIRKMNDLNEFHVSTADSNKVFLHII